MFRCMFTADYSTLPRLVFRREGRKMVELQLPTWSTMCSTELSQFCHVRYGEGELHHEVWQVPSNGSNDQPSTISLQR